MEATSWNENENYEKVAVQEAECEIQINVQSPDIAGGDNAGKDDLAVGAGEQDIEFEYASDEVHSMTIRLGRN